jgi:hypothetical protein
MQTETDLSPDLVDLGAASTETRGGMEGTYDFVGLFIPEGLSDE